METYKPKEAAQILGVTSRTLLNWIQRGDLKAFITPGRHHLYTKASVDRLLTRMRTSSNTSSRATPGCKND